jgi:gliding motility-associated-like protein
MRYFLFILILPFLISCGKDDLKPKGFTETSEKKDSTGKPIYVISFPGSFEPNGDGLNDRFGPIGYGFGNNARFEIYSNQSQRIYYTDDPHDWWDGRVNAGSYTSPQWEFAYCFSFTDTEGGHHDYSGTAVIIR